MERGIYCLAINRVDGIWENSYCYLNQLVFDTLFSIILQKFQYYLRVRQAAGILHTAHQTHDCREVLVTKMEIIKVDRQKVIVCITSI